MKNIAFGGVILFFLTSSVFLLTGTAGSAALGANPKELLVNGDMDVWTNPTTLLNWTFVGTGATLNREGTTRKSGKYSAKLTRHGANINLYQDLENPASYRGKKLTIGCWVWASAPDSVRFVIGGNEHSSTANSPWHTGDSTWQYLTATANIDPAEVLVRITCVVTADATVYFDRASCFFPPKASPRRKKSVSQRQNSFGRITN